MNTLNNELSALKFARSHDWGQSATLSNGYIHGLENMSSLGSDIVAAIPATMSSMRKFGGY